MPFTHMAASNGETQRTFLEDRSRLESVLTEGNAENTIAIIAPAAETAVLFKGAGCCPGVTASHEHPAPLDLRSQACVRAAFRGRVIACFVALFVPTLVHALDSIAAPGNLAR